MEMVTEEFQNPCSSHMWAYVCHHTITNRGLIVVLLSFKGLKLMTSVARPVFDRANDTVSTTRWYF